MRELGRLFRTLCADRHTRWVKCLPDVEFFLNATTHVSTGYSPLELQFGKGPRDRVMDIIRFPEAEVISREAKIGIARDRLVKSFERRSKNQKHLSKINLCEGDLVLLHVPKQSDAVKKVTRKFFHLFYGPYVILKDYGNGSFKLGDPENQDKEIGVHHQINLKKYKSEKA
ncbi:uncharacterized protein LOC122506400 [Leptopilina heterotoma]|uniref:uncharacterized protein LOC122506400 n=1 Tax=Leptopilina heterotoma TaxID=63436 RepID=UPI001CA8A39A|nr:uncharacterized protein LOC122506400 [Leptopilina heterotoma]